MQILINISSLQLMLVTKGWGLFCCKSLRSSSGQWHKQVEDFSHLSVIWKTTVP